MATSSNKSLKPNATPTNSGSEQKMELGKPHYQNEFMHISKTANKQRGRAKDAS